MATKSGFVYDESFVAEQTFAAKQFYIAELSATEGQVDVCDAAADRGIGVIQNNPVAGGAATVRILGKSQVISDGSGTAIAIGDYVGPNSSGKAVKKATADYSAIGIALQASSADGTIIEVLLMPGLWFRTAGG